MVYDGLPGVSREWSHGLCPPMVKPKWSTEKFSRLICNEKSHDRNAITVNVISIVGLPSMKLIHPFQSVGLNASGDLFVAVKNEIVAFKKTEMTEGYKLAGRWVDELAKDLPRAKSLEACDIKRIKHNDGNSSVSKGKNQHGGIAAPPNLLRAMTFSRDESKIFICADSDKSVCVLQFEKGGLNCIKRRAFPKRPSAIAALGDGSQMAVADKFGDVYQIPIVENGKYEAEEELTPILGHVSMLTDVLFSEDDHGKKYLITSDRDEHIRVSHFPQTFLIDKWLFGHREFVSCLHIPTWKPQWLFSAGGDDSVFLWDWVKGTKLSNFQYRDLIQPYLTDAHLAAPRFQNENNDLIEYAVSQVTTCRKLPYAAFFVEATKALIILHVDQKKSTLSFKQVVDLRYNIISLSQTSNGFLVTLDNRESGNKEFIDMVTYIDAKDTFELNKQFGEALDEVINSSLDEDPIANCEAANIAPLYGTINLKKHDEQYS